MTIAELIRATREAKGWSQETLARTAGVSTSTVIRLETGRQVPYAGTLYELADALELSLEDLRAAVRDTDQPGQRRLRAAT